MREASSGQARISGSEKLFEQLFTSSPDAILIVDGTGRITQANPQVEKLFGYSASELLGSLIEVLVPERFRSIHPTHRGDSVSLRGAYICCTPYTRMHLFVAVELDAPLDCPFGLPLESDACLVVAAVFKTVVPSQ